MVKKPMCADVDRGVARLKNGLDEPDPVDLVAPADDVQPDDVIGEIDKQPEILGDLLDHNRAVVGVGVIAVLLLEFGRRHQVVAQFGGAARAGQLRSDHVLVFGLAIEQQPIGPDDMLARQAARVCTGVRCCARSDTNDTGRRATFPEHGANRTS
jgi:hypothetical protein